MSISSAATDTMQNIQQIVGLTSATAPPTRKRNKQVYSSATTDPNDDYLNLINCCSITPGVILNSTSLPETVMRRSWISEHGAYALEGFDTELHAAQFRAATGIFGYGQGSYASAPHVGYSTSLVHQGTVNCLLTYGQGCTLVETSGLMPQHCGVSRSQSQATFLTAIIDSFSGTCRAFLILGAEHEASFEIPPISRALQRVTELEHLEGNWDSYGGAPPTHEALEAARDLILKVAGQLPSAQPDEIVPFAIAPVSGGGVQLEWRRGEDAIEVEISADEHYGFLYISGAGDRRRFEEMDNVTESDVLKRVLSVVG